MCESLNMALFSSRIKCNSSIIDILMFAISNKPNMNEYID